jgi:hypothetical protein
VRPCIFPRRWAAETDDGGRANRGFDLDPSYTSEGEEGGRPNLLQHLPSSLTFFWSRRRTTLHCSDPFQRVVPHQRH